MAITSSTHTCHASSLLILGAGGLGQAVGEIALASGTFAGIAFLDDKPSASCRVVGPLSALAENRCIYSHCIAAFGNNDLRAAYTCQIKELGFLLPILVHPSAAVSPVAHIAPGTIIREQVAVSHFVTVEEGCLLNMGCMIDHNCHIGAYSHIPMGAIVRNGVQIASRSSFTSGEIIQ